MRRSSHTHSGSPVLLVGSAGTVVVGEGVAVSVTVRVEGREVAVVVTVTVSVWVRVSVVTVWVGMVGRVIEVGIVVGMFVGILMPPPPVQAPMTPMSATPASAPAHRFTG
jgi:hypothetical protein